MQLDTIQCNAQGFNSCQLDKHKRECLISNTVITTLSCSGKLENFLLRDKMWKHFRQLNKHWYILVIHCFLVGYASLVFSVYTRAFRLYSENTSDKWHIPRYPTRKHCITTLSHTLKNTANQRPGFPLHILRYATGNMQRVVFHSTFPSLLARNSLLGSIWGLLKSQLRNFSTPAYHYKHFRSRPEIFRTFPKTPEDFPEIFKNHKNIWKLVLNSFRSFPKISEDFRTLLKISEDSPKILKNHKNIEKHFWTVSEVFQKFPKIAKFKLHRQQWYRKSVTDHQ